MPLPLVLSLFFKNGQLEQSVLEEQSIFCLFSFLGRLVEINKKINKS